MSIFENMSFLAIGINALMMLVIFLAAVFVALKISKIIKSFCKFIFLPLKGED